MRRRGTHFLFPMTNGRHKYHRIWIFALLIIIVGFLGCNKLGCYCEVEENIVHLNDSLQKVYARPFPPSTSEWWENYDEPILQNIEGEAYRLSIRISATDYYKIYRLQREGDRCKLTLKEYASADSHNSRMKDSLVSSHSRMIELQEWNEFKRRIDSLCYWTMLVWDGRECFDGSTWILEGFDPNVNDCIDTTALLIFRRCPRDPHFLALGDAFFKFDPWFKKEFWNNRERDTVVQEINNE